MSTRRAAVWLIPSLILSLPLGAAARAGDKPPETRTVCLNLYCTYEKKEEGGKYSACRVASRFTKLVTWEGYEIGDRSAASDDPSFEVECDGQRLFNNSARRFTDGQGTRIQARQGPYPAIVLPRGSLVDDHRYVPSALEFDRQTLRGVCFVYPGEALLF